MSAPLRHGSAKLVLRAGAAFFPGVEAEKNGIIVVVPKDAGTMCGHGRRPQRLRRARLRKTAGRSIKDLRHVHLIFEFDDLLQLIVGHGLRFPVPQQCTSCLRDQRGFSRVRHEIHAHRPACRWIRIR